MKPPMVHVYAVVYVEGSKSPRALNLCDRFGNDMPEQFARAVGAIIESEKEALPPPPHTTQEPIR